VLKGPTAAFMAWAGRPLTSDGVAACYAGLIAGLVADAPAESVPTLVCDVRLDTPAARRRVADETLRFALASIART
jgi:LPPG:FO 2-phospho-L-lactate transferase